MIASYRNLIAAAVCAALMITPELSAQEAAEETRTLLQTLQAGGWAMIPLSILSVAGVGLVLYNALAIREKRFLRLDLVEQAAEMMTEMRLEEAREFCRDNPASTTNIIDAGLERVEAEELDPEAMEKAMEESSTEELAGPYVYINYLAVVATVSPMMGLLGTVSGMIRAFNTIAAEGTGNPQALADNIQEALVTTATGMAIGIPAMIFYFIFKNKYGRIVSRVSRIIGDFHYAFVSSVRRQQQG